MTNDSGYADVARRDRGTLTFDVPRPDRSKRWLIFIRWLLIIPHFFVLWFLFLALWFVLFLGWFGVLILGRYPRGLWNFALMVIRWVTRVNIYLYMLRDEYPSFGDDPYPMRFEVSYPERLARWKLFFKWLFILPHLFVLYFVGLAAGVVWIIAWFAILVTGRYPRGLFRFKVGVLRWYLRVMLYCLCLVDVYPPFSTE